MKHLPSLRHTAIALVSIWLGLMAYICLSNLSGLFTIHDYEVNFGIAVYGASVYIFSGWIVLTPLVLWLGARFPVSPARWIPSLGLHVLLMLGVAVVHALVNSWYYYQSADITPVMENYAPWQHAGHFLFLDDHFLFDGLIYAFLVASRNIRHFHDRAKQQELDALRLESQLTEARLQALRMQLNPHFLFNTINSIQVLISKGEANLAGRMLQKLSDFFRQTLELGQEQCVSLRRELELVDNYVEIEKLRFGARLKVQILVEEDCWPVSLPVLILQPLVENAIRHGLSQTTEKAFISITAEIRQPHMILCVSDNGTGLADDTDTDTAGNGLGLSNTRMRLQTLYGDKAGLDIEKGDKQGVKVTLRIPVVTQASKP